ncbi:MAG: prepilin-type N-terminal cleavage/methylation domain-containing protein [Planctomycetota bacterium]
MTTTFCGFVNKKGFTLMEVMVALGVFMIGFVGVMGLFVGGFRTQEAARVRLTEAMVAETLLDTLREPEVAGLKAALTGVTVATTMPIDASKAFPGYSYFYRYTPCGATVTKHRLLVTVFVFEDRFKDLYGRDYTTLDTEGKAAYDRNCLQVNSIIEMEAE